MIPRLEMNHPSWHLLVIIAHREKNIEKNIKIKTEKNAKD